MHSVIVHIFLLTCNILLTRQIVKQVIAALLAGFGPLICPLPEEKVRAEGSLF